MIYNSPNLLVVPGPTASGKTALGVALAQRQGTPILWLPGGTDMATAALQQPRP